MQTVTTIGLDIAKSVFQVHGIDAEDRVIIRRQLKRRYVLAFFEKLPSCLVGIEACASSHHWSRELKALGHTVRLMPPAYVKPYVKRQKNDATDAEAICEAVTRANMRFVPTKTPEQQSCLMLHRTRHLFIRQQTAVINVIRAHLPSSGSWHQSGARVSRNFSMSSPIQMTTGCPRLHGRASQHLGLNCEGSRSRFWSSTDRSWPGIDLMRRVCGSMRSPVSVRCWLRPWLPASLTQRSFDQGATSRPGLGWCRSSTQAGARTGSVVSASRVTAICAACSWLARCPSSAMPKSTALSIGPGSRHC